MSHIAATIVAIMPWLQSWHHMGRPQLSSQHSHDMPWLSRWQRQPYLPLEIVVRKKLHSTVLRFVSVNMIFQDFVSPEEKEGVNQLYLQNGCIETQVWNTIGKVRIWCENIQIVTVQALTVRSWQVTWQPPGNPSFYFGIGKISFAQPSQADCQPFRLLDITQRAPKR